MTILFPDTRDMGKEIAIRCPRCARRTSTPYRVRKRCAEVCPKCNKVYHMEIFASGAVLVE